MDVRGILPALTLATLAVAAGCTSERGADATSEDGVTPGEWPGAFEADRARYSIRHQNDVMRILTADFGPGESSPMHMHPDHCSIFLDDGTWVVGFPDAPPYEIQVETGDFRCDWAGPHQPTNATQRRARVVVLEIPEGAARGTSSIDGADPVMAAPDHYQVELETYAVRISRVRYDAGEIGTEHGHPAYCMVWIAVEPAPNGPRVGDVDCRFNEVHVPEVFTSPVEMLLIEFMGRAVA